MEDRIALKHPTELVRIMLGMTDRLKASIPHQRHWSKLSNYSSLWNFDVVRMFYFVKNKSLLHSFDEMKSVITICVICAKWIPILQTSFQGSYHIHYFLRKT